MKEDLKCLIGLHRYEIIETLEYLDIRGNNIGKVIISRCKNCGKLKHYKVLTINQSVA